MPVEPGIVGLVHLQPRFHELFIFLSFDDLFEYYWLPLSGQKHQIVCDLSPKGFGSGSGSTPCTASSPVQ